MPLEFALRPRFDLERPKSRRKHRRRFSPLALPIAAYWLAIAGVTHALIRSAQGSAEDGAQAASLEQPPEVAEETPVIAPPSQLSTTTTTPNSAGGTPEPALEPAPLPTPALPHEPVPFAVPASPREPLPVSPRAAIPTAPAIERDRRLERALESSAKLPPRIEHAAPKLPSTFALTDEPPRDRSDVARAAVNPELAKDEGRTVSLPSCEVAASDANESMDLRAAPGAPDLTRDAFASILENGSYLAHCAIPARTALEICAAVQDGKVVGVSVASEPRSSEINACVRRAVANLHFPRSARLDVTRTRFAATR
jgi:hypothetical protein